MRRNFTSLICLGLVLAGCTGNPTDPMNVPVVAAPSNETATERATSLLIGGESNQGTFRLERIVVALPRGTTIAHLPHRFYDKWEYLHLCNVDLGDDAAIEWGSGRGEFGGWTEEVGKIFYDVMRKRGANVVGDASALFRTAEKAQAAEFLVGGRITEIRGNMCSRHQPLTSKRMRQYLGEFYVKVDWEVFSVLSQRVVHKFRTEGYAETKKPKQNGIMVTLFAAYAAAVEHAAQNPGFLAALDRRQKSHAATPSYEPLTIAGSPLYREPLKNQLAEAREATVTIRIGAGGHGSGFLISRDGYLLTNAHVVGEGKRLPVEFRNGLRVTGEVVRVAIDRDVALVKIPLSAAYIHPIAQRNSLAIGDDVYVIGSPANPTLRSTLTKGIVSAFRKLDNNPYIQSDAAVTRGNSGGPMVDDRGNVVGITVSGFRGQNLNLFIPIADALRALNIKVEVD